MTATTPTNSVSFGLLAQNFATIAGADNNITAQEAKDYARTTLYNADGTAKTGLTADQTNLATLMATIAIGGTNKTALVHDPNNDGGIDFIEFAQLGAQSTTDNDKGLTLTAADFKTRFTTQVPDNGTEISFANLGGTPPTDDGGGGGGGGSALLDTYVNLFKGKPGITDAMATTLGTLMKSIVDTLMALLQPSSNTSTSANYASS